MQYVVSSSVAIAARCELTVHNITTHLLAGSQHMVGRTAGVLALLAQAVCSALAPVNAYAPARDMNCCTDFLPARDIYRARNEVRCLQLHHAERQVETSTAPLI